MRWDWMGEKENWPLSKGWISGAGGFAKNWTGRPLFFFVFFMAKRTLISEWLSEHVAICHLKIPHFPHRFSLLTSTGVRDGCRRGVWVSIVQHVNNGKPNTRRREHFPLFDVTQTDRWDGRSNSSQLWSKLNPADGIITEKETLWRRSHRHTHTRIHTHLYRSGRLYLNTQSNTWVKERWLWVSVDCFSSPTSWKLYLTLSSRWNMAYEVISVWPFCVCVRALVQRFILCFIFFKMSTFNFQINVILSSQEKGGESCCFGPQP